tara:strand:- start:580 stop:855 length:276 start_codon:yes stop_codon:yes gene_type:complete
MTTTNSYYIKEALLSEKEIALRDIAKMFGEVITELNYSKRYSNSTLLDFEGTVLKHLKVNNYSEVVTLSFMRNSMIWACNDKDFKKKESTK